MTDNVEELQQMVRTLSDRVAELQEWPDTGEQMDRTSTESLLVGWRNRCLAAEHKNAKLLAELDHLRRQYMQMREQVPCQ